MRIKAVGKAPSRVSPSGMHVLDRPARGRSRSIVRLWTSWMKIGGMPEPWRGDDLEGSARALVPPA